MILNIFGQIEICVSRCLAKIKIKNPKHFISVRLFCAENSVPRICYIRKSLSNQRDSLLNVHKVIFLLMDVGNSESPKIVGELAQAELPLLEAYRIRKLNHLAMDVSYRS